MSNNFRHSPWDEATKKATRVIEINRWRTLDWGYNAPVYFLHELYNNKRQLAIAYVKLKRCNEAQQLLEELMEGKMHRKNPILIASKQWLVAAYVGSVQWEKAESFQEKILEELGGDADDLSLALDKLASIRELAVTFYIESGQLDRAERFQEKIIEATSEKLGYDSVELIPALEKLADIYQKNKHLGKRHHIKLRLLRYR